MLSNKNILVAPLNWGLGHATRCIPIIRKLIQFGANPIIASDGDALRLLKFEFPNLEFIELPSYNVRYSRSRKYFKLKMIYNIFSINKAISQENELLSEILKKYNIHGIISDNRYGVYDDKIPSVFITHQVNILTGFSDKIINKFHHNIISKFSECWVPDFKGLYNLSGELSYYNDSKFKLKYIGVQSRFIKEEKPLKYDLAVVISGPEPQRTIFNDLVLDKLSDFKGKVVLVGGKIQDDQLYSRYSHIECVNFVTSVELQDILNQSKLVLSRSGYTSLMDYSVLEKKVLYVPTPGQPEQEYLAKRLKKHQVAPFCKQEIFSVDKLDSVKFYKGHISPNFETDWNDVFSVFK